MGLARTPERQDIRELARLIGRDEMNLAEFPITLLTERVPDGLKTIEFQAGAGKLVVSGSDDYGLPTAADGDVIVGLIQLTKIRNDFTDPTVDFTRYELLKILGWPDRGAYYQRLDDSLHRWVGVTLRYDEAWWDNEIKCRVNAAFHILESVVIDRAVGEEEAQGPRPAATPLLAIHLEQDFLPELPGRQLEEARPRDLPVARECRLETDVSIPRQTLLRALRVDLRPPSVRIRAHRPESELHGGQDQGEAPARHRRAGNHRLHRQDGPRFALREGRPRRVEDHACPEGGPEGQRDGNHRPRSTNSSKP